MPRNRSDNCKDLLKKMLVVQPSKRITADEILKHPWITETNRDYYKCSHDHGVNLDSGLIAKLEAYQGRSALKRELLHILVRQLEGISDQETFIRHEFQGIDKNKSGFIERDQLC